VFPSFPFIFSFGADMKIEEVICCVLIELRSRVWVRSHYLQSFAFTVYSVCYLFVHEFLASSYRNLALAIQRYHVAAQHRDKLHGVVLR